MPETKVVVLDKGAKLSSHNDKLYETISRMLDIHERIINTLLPAVVVESPCRLSAEEQVRMRKEWQAAMNQQSAP